MAGELTRCPKCNTECARDEVHNGVMMLYGPWGCPGCAWSESEDYDLSNGQSPFDSRGGMIDQYGHYHPAGSFDPEDGPDYTRRSALAAAEKEEG